MRKKSVMMALALAAAMTATAMPAMPIAAASVVEEEETDVTGEEQTLTDAGESAVSEEQTAEEDADAEEEDEDLVGGSYELTNEANYDALKDAGKIALTPGEDETEMNFAWYSETKGTPQVKLGTKADLSDAKVYTGTAVDIDRTTKGSKDEQAADGMDYKAANRVETGKGALAENTTYYYAYSTDGTTWSDTFHFATHDSKSFSAVVVGDPQIGSSGDKKLGSEGWKKESDASAAHDVSGWTKTLQEATTIDPSLSFILSVGDQIQYKSPAKKDFYSMREREYAAFLYPDLMRQLPISTTVGNHDSIGNDYRLHFDNPNSADNLGETNAGCDYFYSYGDVLFIVLNSNNRNAAEHEALIQKAVASHPDAKWRVAMFHHDIYGAGVEHSDGDSANIRIILAPLRNPKLKTA